MSDTPKTDAAACDGWSGDACCVSYEFARDQERLINELLDAARKAEAIFARARWLDTGPDPEAVALRELRAAIAKATHIPADESVQS